MEFHAGTCYTMFNAFHHFNDSDKVKTAEKIQAAGRNAFFAEILEPSFFCLLKVIFLTTVGALLFTPFVKPFSIKRLLLTYVFPINIFTIFFDGVVSVFKSRSVKQYRKLFAHLGESIKVFRFKNFLSPLIIIQIHDRR